MFEACNSWSGPFAYCLAFSAIGARLVTIFQLQIAVGERCE